MAFAGLALGIGAAFGFLRAAALIFWALRGVRDVDMPTVRASHQVRSEKEFEVQVDGIGLGVENGNESPYMTPSANVKPHDAPENNEPSI
jgi:hypothetical protein